jgi:hypothetical protein
MSPVLVWIHEARISLAFSYSATSIAHSSLVASLTRDVRVLTRAMSPG